MKQEHEFLSKTLADFEIPAMGARYIVTGNVSMSPVEGSDLRTGKELLSGIIMSEKIDMVTKNSEPIENNLDKDDMRFAEKWETGRKSSSRTRMLREHGASLISPGIGGERLQSLRLCQRAETLITAEQRQRFFSPQRGKC